LLLGSDTQALKCLTSTAQRGSASPAAPCGSQTTSTHDGRTIMYKIIEFDGGVIVANC